MVENLKKIINENSSDEDLKKLREVYEQVIVKKNKSYLDKFSKVELVKIMNTFYATKGFIFKDEETKKHFESKAWYKEKYHYVPSEEFSMNEVFFTSYLQQSEFKKK